MKTMNAIQNFLEAKQADGTDPKTLKWYRAMLKPLSDNYGNVNVGQISTPDMRELMIAPPDTAGADVVRKARKAFFK